jgi:tRNA-modifying protein YgfZ
LKIAVSPEKLKAWSVLLISAGVPTPWFRNDSLKSSNCAFVTKTGKQLWCSWRLETQQKRAKLRNMPQLTANTLPRTVIEVLGEDAEAFLDALVTQSMSLALVGRPAYGGLLTPQGKYIADFLIWRQEDGAFWLDTPTSVAEALINRLRLYRLKAKVDISVRADLSVFAYPPDSPHASDPRLAAFATRRIGQLIEEESVPPYSVTAWTERRVANGLPEGPPDVAPERDFWLEALGEELSGVDFKKGCFVGQETVSRMKRRTPARSKIITFEIENRAPPGETITVDGFRIGTLGSVATNRALGLVRLDHALEAAETGKTIRAGDAVLAVNDLTALQNMIRKERTE